MAFARFWTASGHVRCQAPCLQTHRTVPQAGLAEHEEEEQPDRARQGKPGQKQDDARVAWARADVQAEAPVDSLHLDQVAVADTGWDAHAERSRGRCRPAPAAVEARRGGRMANASAGGAGLYLEQPEGRRFGHPAQASGSAAAYALGRQHPGRNTETVTAAARVQLLEFDLLRGARSASYQARVSSSGGTAGAGRATGRRRPQNPTRS
jgi:hypothetical protein